MIGTKTTQCPTVAEREGAIDGLVAIMFEDNAFPSSFPEVPSFIAAMSQFLNDNSTMEVSASGAWPSVAVISEYSLLWKTFVGVMEFVSIDWQTDYTWLDGDTVVRDGLATLHRLGNAPNTIWSFPVQLTYTFEDCGLFIHYLYLDFTDVFAYASGYFTGHPVASLVGFCAAVAGYTDPTTGNPVNGYCGPMNQTQPSVFGQTEDTTEYNSFEECMFINMQKPLTCNDLGSFWKGDTILCRQLHQIFLPVDPSIHCNHVGPNSDFCKPEACTNYPEPQCSIIPDAIGTNYDCQTPVCSYETALSDSYLSGFAGTSASFDATADAELMCCLSDQLYGESCSGFTKSTDGTFTIRTGALDVSTTGEESYRLVGANDPSCGFELPTANTYHLGYACGILESFDVVEDAKAACCGCPSCSGITCSGGECTIRAGGVGLSSPSGETTYEKSTGQVSCLHLEGTLAGGFGSEGITPGSGTIVVDIAPDLESFHIVVEWTAITGAAKGMMIHDPDLMLKAVHLCPDDLTSPCDRTIRRGDQNAYITWDAIIDGMLNNLGFFVIVHTEVFPAGELWGDLYCDGIVVQQPVYPCNVGNVCPTVVFNCFNDPLCIAWFTLYSFDVCHLDPGRDPALSTHVEECFAYLSAPTNTATFEAAKGFSDCMLSCGV